MCAVIIEECFSCWKHNVTNVAVVGVQMDHSCSRVLKILRFNFLLLLNTSGKNMRMKRGFVKNSLENALRSPMGKQLRFT